MWDSAMWDREWRLAEAEARHDVAARKGQIRNEGMLSRYLSAADYRERRRIDEETDEDGDRPPASRRTGGHREEVGRG